MAKARARQVAWRKQSLVEAEKLQAAKELRKKAEVAAIWGHQPLPLPGLGL